MPVSYTAKLYIDIMSQHGVFQSTRAEQVNKNNGTVDRVGGEGREGGGGLCAALIQGVAY